MPKFKVDINWEESHGGSVIIEEDSIEALEDKLDRVTYSNVRQAVRDKLGDNSFNEIHFTEILDVKQVKSSEVADAEL